MSNGRTSYFLRLRGMRHLNEDTLMRKDKHKKRKVFFHGIFKVDEVKKVRGKTMYNPIRKPLSGVDRCP